MRVLTRSGQIAIAWLGLVVAQRIAEVVVPVNAPSVGNILGWMVASDFLIAAALGFAALRSRVEGLETRARVGIHPGWDHCVDRD